MNISDDVEVYKLSKLSQVFGDDKSADFLYDYWLRSNKLQYLPEFLGNHRVTVGSDEVQYVVATEALLETFVETLNGFVTDRFCSTERTSPSMDSATAQMCDEFMVELENFRQITFDAGWVDLYEDLSRAIAKTTAKIDRLISAYNSGKRFHFVTNVKPIDLISGKTVNLKSKTGKYFILDK